MSKLSLTSYPVMVKFFACVATAGGITFAPYIYSSENISTPLKEKKKKSVTLGKSSQSDGNLSLSSIDNIEKLLTGATTRLTFKELGMKWGDKSLSENDILHSPRQDGKYYLLKYKGNSKYEFEDGISYLDRDEVDRQEKLKHIYLGWTKYNLGSVLLTNITVGSCSLSKVFESKIIDKFKLQLTCRAYLNHGDIVKGNYGEESYEYYK